MCHFFTYMAPLRTVREIRHSPLYRSSLMPKLKCKYSVSLSFIIPSSTWPDMESVSSIILSEIFIVGENHMNSFLRKVTLWSTHFHISSLFLKTVMYFWSRTSDLTTSKADTERSWLDIKHPMHLLFYLVSPASSQFKHR